MDNKTPPRRKPLVFAQRAPRAGGGFACSLREPRSCFAPPRVRLLDILRGFSVLSMVVYHALFDVVHLFGHPMPWYTGTPGYLWQQSICWVFIAVSGASLHYGRHTLRRGLVVLGCAAAVSVVSMVAMPSQRVWFGILHLIALAMLLGALLKKVLHKMPAGLGLGVCLALFLLAKTLPQGYLGVGDARLWALPVGLYQTPFLFPLGLPGPGFFSGDYFPLLPWLFLYFAGYFLWGLLKNRAVLFSPAPRGKNPLEWIGRHSLWVYMAHQPVIYGVLLLLRQVGFM